MKINIFLVICVSAALCSCANLGDSWTELGSGYVCRVDGSNCWIRGDYIFKESIYPNVLDYAFDDNYILVLQQPSKKGYTEFLCQDLRYKYEGIIDNIDTSKTIYKSRFLTSYLWKDSTIHARVAKEILPNNQASFEKIYSIADSIVKNDAGYKKHFARKFNYWIIQKKDDVILGPFSKHEYIETRRQLNIGDNIQLKRDSGNN